MNAGDKRQHQRLELNSAVLIASQRQAWLSSVQDVSSGGARLVKPLDWRSPGTIPLNLYFIFDQDTVLTLRATLVRDAQDHLGFWFKSGQDDEIVRLLYETRFATNA